MNDLEIFRAMTVACEMFADFRVADLADLLGRIEASRFEQLMSQAFPLYKTTWPALAGEEAATAIGMVAAMVESGDLAA